MNLILLIWFFGNISVIIDVDTLELLLIGFYLHINTFWSLCYMDVQIGLKNIKIYLFQM